MSLWWPLSCCWKIRDSQFHQNSCYVNHPAPDNFWYHYLPYSHAFLGISHAEIWSSSREPAARRHNARVTDSTDAYTYFFSLFHGLPSKPLPWSTESTTRYMPNHLIVYSTTYFHSFDCVIRHIRPVFINRQALQTTFSSRFHSTSNKQTQERISRTKFPYNTTVPFHHIRPVVSLLLGNCIQLHGFSVLHNSHLTFFHITHTTLHHIILAFPHPFLGK